MTNIEHGDIKTIIEVANPHAIISCTPYFLNPLIAEFAIQYSISYFDLGGNISISGDIHSSALLSGNSTVFTDLGLAPGWVNIQAEELIAKATKEIFSVDMFCGGLPQNPKEHGPLKYMRTWSLDGLINEYIEDAIILVDGETKQVPGMSGLLPLGEKLETFYTSGGAAHSIELMSERGIKNLSYSTIRYRGHCEIMRWLLKGGVGREILEKLIPLPSEEDKNKDVVITNTEVSYVDGTKDKVDNSIFGCSRFSAIQKTTAFPVAAVVEHHSKMRQGVLNYSDVPFEDFNSTVKYLFDKLA
jgi:saccharopine dehydrogenase-like NADP-dependent oxidoreductase